MSSRVFKFAATALIATLFSASALTAQEFNGTTLGGPTWNRPLAGDPPGGLSVVGTNVSYNVVQFRVTLAGTYDFLSEALVPSSWDNFLLLYAGSFNAAAPLDNVVIGNDDFPFIGLAGFNDVALATNTDYYAVTTGFGNTHAGTYRLTIAGPGQAFVPQPPVNVPEPTSMALLCLGMSGMGLVARRRRVS